MPFCAALMCHSKQAKGCGKTFHVFPKNADRRKTWVTNMKREHFVPSDRSVLCSDHFEDSCFDRTGQTVRIRADAVPTIFSFPKHLKRTRKFRKLPTKNRAHKAASSETKSSSAESTSNKAPECILINAIPRENSLTNTKPRDKTFTNTRPRESILISIRPRENALTCTRSTENILRTGECVSPLRNTDDIPFSLDHSYCIFSTPLGLKKRLDSALDIVVSYKKKLKLAQEKIRRLQKQVKTLKEVVEEFRQLHPDMAECEVLENIAREKG